ncbi:MAG: 23S rRNA (uracil(1939)-C(5))-methyltransferase RlmD [Thermoanaerobaculaceae bacterium]
MGTRDTRTKDKALRRSGKPPERPGGPPRRQAADSTQRSTPHRQAPRPSQRPTQRPAPGEVAEVVIGRLDEDGLGVAQLGGHELRVPLALPGERVEVNLGRRGAGAAYGRLERVLLPSVHRVPSPCRHAGSCVACPLVAMAYEAQLALKRERVGEAIGRYPRLAGTEVREVWAAPDPLGYRATAKLSLARTRSGVIVGMNRPGSRMVVDTPACPVHHPLVNAVAVAVRKEATRLRLDVFDPETERGLLRFVVVKVAPARRSAMVVLVASRRDLGTLTRLAKGLEAQVPEVVSVFGSVNTSDSGMVLGREMFRILGAPDLFDQVGDVRLRISPAAFFQVNHAQAARIYAQVREWAALTKAETALDLYCGIGPIALHLARDAGRVLGIELVPDAVRDARANAEANGLGNCSFRAGDAIELLRSAAGRVERPAVAVVNPPRAGCEPAVLSALAGLRPRALLYVSCNPDTLARDLDLLAGHGFRTAEVQPVDMFPQTAHVECIARLAPSGRS